VPLFAPSFVRAPSPRGMRFRHKILETLIKLPYWWRPEVSISSGLWSVPGCDRRTNGQTHLTPITVTNVYDVLQRRRRSILRAAETAEAACIPWWRQRPRDWWRRDFAARWAVLSRGRRAASAAWSSRGSVTSNRSWRLQPAWRLRTTLQDDAIPRRIRCPAADRPRRASVVRLILHRCCADARLRSAPTAAAAAAADDDDVVVRAALASKTRRWLPFVRSRRDTRKTRWTRWTIVCRARVVATTLARTSLLLAGLINDVQHVACKADMHNIYNAHL